jgi:hypothetical protein
MGSRDFSGGKRDLAVKLITPQSSVEAKNDGAIPPLPHTFLCFLINYAQGQLDLYYYRCNDKALLAEGMTCVVVLPYPLSIAMQVKGFVIGHVRSSTSSYHSFDNSERVSLNSLRVRVI